MLMHVNIAGEDYVVMTTGHRLTLNSDASALISIPLINDKIFELTESFLVNISFSDGESPVPRVTLNQASATVAIFDNDGNSVIAATKG